MSVSSQKAIFFLGGGGAVGLFTILFERVGFQMFSEHRQGLCCSSFRGKLVPHRGAGTEELGLGSCPPVGLGVPRDGRTECSGWV